MRWKPSSVIVATTGNQGDSDVTVRGNCGRWVLVLVLFTSLMDVRGNWGTINGGQQLPEPWISARKSQQLLISIPLALLLILQFPVFNTFLSEIPKVFSIAYTTTWPIDRTYKAFHAQAPISLTNLISWCSFLLSLHTYPSAYTAVEPCWTTSDPQMYHVFLIPVTSLQLSNSYWFFKIQLEPYLLRESFPDISALTCQLKIKNFSFFLLPPSMWASTYVWDIPHSYRAEASASNEIEDASCLLSHFTCS